MTTSFYIFDKSSNTDNIYFDDQGNSVDSIEEAHGWGTEKDANDIASEMAGTGKWWSIVEK